MSIEIGKIKLIDKIDENKFFKFKQGRKEYYAISLIFAEKEEGYLAFSLEKNLDRLFKHSEYNKDIMIELIEDKIGELYFLSFADENPESEVIEYVGNIEKKTAMDIYKKNR